MILKKLKKILTQECEHEWVEEGPTENIGGILGWIEPFCDYCKKCGKRRIHPDSEPNKAPQQ